MRIHWGFKEDILRLLSEAALAPAHSPEQEQLLNEACVLLWRFDKHIIPRSSEDIFPLLSMDISCWLPKSVNLLYTGQLLAKGHPTTLPRTILTDISGHSLSLRDKIINDLLLSNSKRATTTKDFRALVSSENLSGVIKAKNIADPSTLQLYEPFAESEAQKFILLCRQCSYPLDSAGDYLICTAPFCSNVRYSAHPPHPPVPFSRKQKPLKKIFAHGTLKLRHIIWRTIATPLQLEYRMISYFKKTLPPATYSTLALIDDRPGISIIEGDKKIQLEPVATHSASTIENYYGSLDNTNPTWIIVPDGTRYLFQHLKARLPTNYTIVTARSYPYEYLATFHNLAKRGGRRIRCQ